jgi:hypothetical protein
MKRLLGQVDVLLRAHGKNLRSAVSSGVIPRGVVLVAIVSLAGLYGFFMGWYALRTLGMDGIRQMVSSTIKLPLLYLLTIAVTFPSLYVFGTLGGSTLSFRQSLRTIAEWIAIMAAVAASLGPILGFFTLSTDSYPFIVALNIVLLGVSGLAGCAALRRRLGYERVEVEGPVRPVGSDAMRGRGFWVWVVIFGCVGLQMAWVMRPFIGAPGVGFAIFRATESNALEAVLRVLGALFGIE